jgi:type IV pilus assembly protein PilQ
VKPQITPDGNIIMSLDVNKDAVGQVTTAGFAIDTKHVKTEVLIENGGTVVIGGIYTQDVRTTIAKVPFFGDLPLVGVLFRNTQRTDNKTELLVFITPRIVDERIGQR